MYDTSKEQIHYVENPFSYKIGDRINGIERKFLEDEIYKDRDFVVNYRSLTKDMKKLRSATYFMKNTKAELIGMLIINYRVNELIEMRGLLNQLINGPNNDEYAKEEYNFLESLNLSFEDLMNSTIEEVIHMYNVPPERLSLDEKLEIIKTLNERGVFLMKGSVNEVAKELNCSEVTIYRYIRELYGSDYPK